MQDKLKELKEIQAKISDLASSAAVLSWDRETYMPDGGSEARGNSLATLSQLIHELGTDKRVGKLLDELEVWAKGQDPDSDDARLIKVTRREYNKAVKVPPEMVVEKAKMTNAANMAWREAREKSDFSLFESHLEKLIDFNQRYADLFKPFDHPYDVLLDDYEPNMKTADVKQIFSEIRPKQVEILEKITAQSQVDDRVLHKFYPDADQVAMGKEITAGIGYDFNRGRQDRTHHPFSTNLGYGDQRITYRVDENFFNTYIFAAMHEAGHAIYEQGIPESLTRTILYGGTSLGIHESQSRLWENLVGRSLPFWEWYYPKLQARFPEQTKGIDLETFYKAINKVEPSYIRVEADEATYNLHIMLRLELEIEMLEGKISAKELPEAWNSRFEEYLGIKPKNDADGCLQDVHWSFGLFGYFSTYALGNLISLQLWEKISRDMPDLEDQIRRGDFGGLLKWLIDEVYVSGSKFEPQELVERITGSKINGDAYIRYLNKKYSNIYGF